MSKPPRYDSDGNDLYAFSLSFEITCGHPLGGEIVVAGFTADEAASLSRTLAGARTEAAKKLRAALEEIQELHTPPEP